MPKATQPTRIGSIEFDALLSIEETQDASVPEYPVDEGFTISDSINRKAEVISMSLLLTDTPVTWASRFRGQTGRAANACQQLKELYRSNSLVTITTGINAYTDMAITNLSITESPETGGAFEVSVTAQHVRVTAAKTVSIPASYGKSGATGAAAGTASTSTGSGSSGGANGNSSSVLYNVSKSVGLLK